jgi:hypothetical protein
LSSKELSSIGPPSGSPYSYMLYRKELIEIEMKQRLQQVKESSSPPASIDDSSIHGSRSSHLDIVISKSTARASSNEARKCRRAEHHKAITRDLTDIVTDLFIAESKLLNPSLYGVESSPKDLPREQIFQNVERFIASLPPRYAVGVETPSEVLLHMRLMAAVRADPIRPTVHIANLDDVTHWTSSSTPSVAKDGKSYRRLVTICCSDETGLLEYISKLLATGGTRVLDADVLLSSDNIALDRFVLEMNGRLRLDKLAYYIEQFLAKARQNRYDKHHESSSTRSEDDRSAVTKSITVPITESKDDQQLPTSLYFVGETYSRQSHATDKILLEEIDTAIPLEQALAKGTSRNLLSNLVNDEPFLPLTRSITLLPSRSLSLRNDSTEPPTNHSNMETSEGGALSHPSFGAVTVPDEVPTSKAATGGSGRNIRQQRPLINRPGNSILGGSKDDRSEQDLFVAADESSPSALQKRDLFVAADESSPNAMQKRAVPFIPFSELMLIEALGMGRVSTIYRAAWRWRTTDQLSESYENIRMVALKVAMVNKASGDSSNVDELRREVDIASRLQHPNICDLVGIAQDDE